MSCLVLVAVHFAVKYIMLEGVGDTYALKGRGQGVELFENDGIRPYLDR